jgi:hypothetical protein
MKSFSLSAILFFAGIISVLAQPSPLPKEDAFDVKWGTEYKFPRKHIDLGYVGTMEEGFAQMCLRYKKDIIMQGFDTKLKLTKQTKIDIRKMPKSIVSEGFYTFNKKHYWFYSTWIRKEKKERLFAQEVDVVGLRFNGKAIELTKSDKLAGSGFVVKGMYSFDVAGKYKINTSTDSTQLLISYRKAPKERDDTKNKDKLGFFVFNQDLEKVWGKELKMPYTESKMDNIDYDVDKFGNAYLLAKVYKGNRKEKTKEGAPNYNYEILQISQQSKDIKKIPVTLSDKFINDILITDDLNGNIICAGLYSKNAHGGTGFRWGSGSTPTASDGVFVTRVDTTGNFVNVHKGYYEFPTEVLKQYETERSQKKVDKKEKEDKAEAGNLRLRKVLVNEDGSVIVTGEEYYYTEHTTTSRTAGGATSSRTTYTMHYDDILAMKIGVSGEIDWIHKIPKRQVGSASYVAPFDMSFKLFRSGENFYFIYIDNAKNMKLKPDEYPAVHMANAKGVVVYAKINNEGQLTKGKILDKGAEKIRLDALDFQQVGSKSLINRATRKGYSKAVLVTEE